MAQAVWSGLLVLTGGASALTNYTGFAVVLFAGVAVAALFVLRQREPHAPRPFSAWGYPVAPAVFALASFAIVANAVWTDLVDAARGRTWGPSAAGLLIIAAGCRSILMRVMEPAAGSIPEECTAGSKLNRLTGLYGTRLSSPSRWSSGRAARELRSQRSRSRRR